MLTSLKLQGGEKVIEGFKSVQLGLFQRIQDRFAISLEQVAEAVNTIPGQLESEDFPRRGTTGEELENLLET